MDISTIEHQTKTYGPRFFTENGQRYRITANVSHDDERHNGHNTFAITADIRRAGNGHWMEDSSGSLHDEVAKHFPDLAPLIKWHLTSTDGPMHYVANTVYHATAIPEKQDKWYFYLEEKLIKIVDETERVEMVTKYDTKAIFKDYPNSMAKEANLEFARSSAIWPDATLDQLRDKNALAARLPTLLKEFRIAVEALGLMYEGRS